MNTGLLILRIVFGGLVVLHGTQKLFGWFKGPGVDGLAGYLASMRIAAPRRMALVLGSVEILAGVAFATGTVTPLASAAIIGVMVAAMWLVHRPHGLFAASNGIEFPLTIAAVAAAVAFSGAGRFSIEHAAGWDFTDPLYGIGAIVLGVLSAGAVIASRSRREPPEPPERGLTGRATARTRPVATARHPKQTPQKVRA